jgi:hypothetical protein
MIKNINLGFIFLLAGCVDVPGVPVDGQIYECVVIDAADGRELDRINQCGPWDDWRPAAELTQVLYPGQDIDCRGTRIACDRKDDE